MIYGIGTDIIEVKRIEGSVERFGQHFLDRIFSADEQVYCLRHRDSSRHFAGRFAAKEAIVKSLGTGFRDGIHWLDIEIINDVHGKPVVQLSKKLKELFDSPVVHLSISHGKDYATAFAICEARNSMREQ
jgi:holo-[acyl-carrier protein] synthase